MERSHIPTQHRERRPFQFSLRSMLVLMAGIAIIVALSVAACRKISEFSRGRHGPVKDRTEWDRPLQELLADAAGAEIQVEPVSVYLSHGGFWDYYYVWRMSASPELIALMTQRWGLGPATAGDIARFWQDMPPEWPTANTTSPKRYLAAYHPDADNFIVMIDDTAGLVYVWYWFDF
jgi:hypothetical protein